MRDLPGPGIEPLAEGFLTTGPSGKSQLFFFFQMEFKVIEVYILENVNCKLSWFLNNLYGALEVRPKSSWGVESMSMSTKKYFSLVLIRQTALSQQAIP